MPITRGGQHFEDDALTLLRKEPRLNKSPMSQDEALTHLREYRRTDNVNHRNRIVEGFYAVQVWVALNHFNGSVALGDLLQESTMGFIKGVEKYKPEGKTKLITYGKTCCDNAVKDYMANHSRLVRVSKEILTMYEKVRGEAHDIAHQLEREYFTPDMIVPKSNEVTERRYAHAIRDIRQTVSNVRGHESGSEELYSEYDRELIRDQIAGLPQTERLIIEAFASLDSIEYETWLTKARIPSNLAAEVVSQTLGKFRQACGVAHR